MARQKADDPHQPRLLLWESDVTASGDGRSIVTARRLVGDCSVETAQKILGNCPRKVVYRLRKAGRIDGMKPGAIEERKDGKRSNAKLILDMESVLRYREKMRSAKD
jgi:hypothetical protein